MHPGLTGYIPFFWQFLCTAHRLKKSPGNKDSFGLRELLVPKVVFIQKGCQIIPLYMNKQGGTRKHMGYGWDVSGPQLQHSLQEGQGWQLG